jgi:hypothetical protein
MTFDQVTLGQKTFGSKAFHKVISAQRKFGIITLIETVFGRMTLSLMTFDQMKFGKKTSGKKTGKKAFGKKTFGQRASNEITVG